MIRLRNLSRNRSSSGSVAVRLLIRNKQSSSVEPLKVARMLICRPSSSSLLSFTIGRRPGAARGTMTSRPLMPGLGCTRKEPM